MTDDSTAASTATEGTKEDTTQCSTGAPSTTDPGPKPKPCTRKIRFEAAVLVLLSLGLAQIVVLMIGPSIITMALAIFLLLFSHEWNHVHLPSLSRVRRAYFDVSNVLETYQPRARTHGHLFQPEPDTPGVVKFAPTTEDDSNNPKNAEFNNARDAHYANMFEYAQKMAKEMAVIEKAAAAPQLDAGAPADAKLVEANPVEDQKKAAEKKKKEADDYKKQLEKPFCC